MNIVSSSELRVSGRKARLGLAIKPATRNLKLETIKFRIQSYPKFYREVWRTCATIPRGEVRTYGWIARKIGHPKAARAVGQALGKNPFAPIIPCHRVVRASGDLGGYSAPGGLKRKQELLRREGWKG